MTGTYCGGRSRAIRVFLFKHFKVMGIISLTSDAFAPYTTTKTNILFAEKKADSEILLWDNTWSTYSSMYERLKTEIIRFISIPNFYKRILEVINSYFKNIGENYNISDISEIALDILHSISSQISMDVIDDSQRVNGILLENIAQRINLSDQEDILTLSKIISRKRSLIPSLKEFITIILLQSTLASNLQQLLGPLFDDTHRNLPIDELANEYKEEIKNADHDWWVFKRVTEDLLNYPIVLSHAEEIGYKRGVRGEENRPNELFFIGNDNEVQINTNDPQTILDEFLSNIRWVTN